jgi:hypothetical protein
LEIDRLGPTESLDADAIAKLRADGVLGAGEGDDMRRRAAAIAGLVERRMQGAWDRPIFVHIAPV